MSTASRVLREPWHELSRQRQGATFGIWVFLASEALFFGSLLLALYDRSHLPSGGFYHRRARDRHLVRHDQYRGLDDQQPHHGGRSTGRGSRHAEAGDVVLIARRWPSACYSWCSRVLSMPRICEKHLWPGANFALKDPAAQLFFALYWTLTGVHAIHLTHRARAYRATDRHGRVAPNSIARKSAGGSNSALLAPGRRHLDHSLPADLFDGQIMNTSAYAIWRRNILVWLALLVLLLSDLRRCLSSARGRQSRCWSCHRDDQGGPCRCVFMGLASSDSLDQACSGSRNCSGSTFMFALTLSDVLARLANK